MVQQIEEYAKEYRRHESILDQLAKIEKALQPAQEANLIRFQSILKFYNRQVELNRMKPRSETLTYNNLKITIIAKDDQFVDIDVEAIEEDEP